MLKRLGTMCAALAIALMVCAAPAQARSGAHFGGAHFGGGHYASGAHYGSFRAVGIGGRYYGTRGHYYAGHYGNYHGHWRPHYGRYWGPYYEGGYYGDYWAFYLEAAAAAAFSAEPYEYDNDAVRYCIQRFKGTSNNCRGSQSRTSLG
jgi:hypothetical protein